MCCLHFPDSLINTQILYSMIPDGVHCFEFAFKQFQLEIELLRSECNKTCRMEQNTNRKQTQTKK